MFNVCSNGGERFCDLVVKPQKKHIGFKVVHNQIALVRLWHYRLRNFAIDKTCRV